MSPTPSPPGVAILMYHSIAPAGTDAFGELTVPPSLFAEHLAALVESGCELVRVAEVPALLAQPPARGPRVAITLDDGLADVATGAAPALAAHGLPATLFVPSAYVGDRARWLSGADARRPLLSWSELAQLADAGLEIGSHGHLHLAADVNDPAHVREDAIRSRATLEERLARPVRSYAYPFGYRTPRAGAAVAQAGFAQACAVAELPAVAGEDRFALPRLHARPHTTPEELVALVRHRPAGALRRWAHAKQSLWRAGRRLAGWGPAEAGVLSPERLAIELGA
ncbi:MAG TPA: polysaccharide deacetylase family protein [Solirubrobacteraceae bacterium]|nr:polysaccharide deacetylase family protein [Solirubrobacteraceae bacterium]